MTPKCQDCKRDQDDCICASPASAPEGWKDFLQDLTQKISEAMDHTPDSFHREMVRLAHRAHKLLAAAPTPPENRALLEAVAEVVWYDPQLSHSPEKPGKIIDGSIAFMESAEIGTKLFAAPTPPVSEDQKDAERFREGWTHACNALCLDGVELWIPQCPHCGKPAPTPPVSEDRNKLELYGELLYAVANKFPGESRHQTALRYIRNAEKGSDNATTQEGKR